MKILNWKMMIVVGFAVMLPGCDGNNGDPSTEDNAKDRKAILTHWVDNIVVPSYAQFNVALDALVSKTNNFSTTPNISSLSELRSAWVAAYLEWQNVELFEFGPADRYSMRNFFNIYPTNVAAIQANINTPSPNLEVPAAYATQGFPALDFLINGVASDDNQIVAYYTTHTNATENLAYLNLLVSRMEARLSSVIAEWMSYRDTFISKTGLDIGSSMGLAVNAYVLNYERYIRTGKIGIPSGSTIAAAGAPYPEKVEAYYKKDISGLLAEQAHEASLRFFNGVDFVTNEPGPSFRSYLDALEARDASTDTMLSDLIETQFLNISSRLSGLSPNFYNQVQTNNQSMVDTYAAMQQLVRMLKVDMTSAMSVTITYTDNDGD